MEFNNSDGPRGTDDEIEEFNFGNLAEMMKKMGGLVGTVATDVNKSIDKVSEVFTKIGVSLTEEERDQIDELFLNLSGQEKKQLIDMAKGGSDNKTVREWWTGKCENEHLIDVLVSCSDAFGEIFNTGNDIEHLMSTFGNFSGDKQEGLADVINLMAGDKQEGLSNVINLMATVGMDMFGGKKNTEPSESSESSEQARSANEDDDLLYSHG